MPGALFTAPGSWFISKFNASLRVIGPDTLLQYLRLLGSHSFQAFKRFADRHYHGDDRHGDRSH